MKNVTMIEKLHNHLAMVVNHFFGGGVRVE